MKTLSDITLYELMAEDHSVWVSKNSKFGFDLFIENEDGEEFCEKGIHPFAMEGLADFCNRYLRFYSKYQEATHGRF